MIEKYKYLSKNIFLFALSSLAPKAVVFFLVPLYTNCLSTSDYGIGDIITTTVSLVLPIFTVCIYSAIIRFCFDDNFSHSEVLSCSLFVLFRGFLVFVCIALLCAFFSPLRVYNEHLFAFMMIFFANAFYEVLSNFCRGTEQIKVVVEISLITTVSTCLLNVLFLLPLKMGLWGFLLANYVGTFLAVAWGGWRIKVWRYVSVACVNKQKIKEMQKFSFPLMFTRLGWWVNGVLDRYIVTWMLGVTVNGVYTIAYKIPTILTAFSDVFSQAWQLSAIKDFDKDDADGFVSRMYKTFNAYLVICCSILILFDIPLSKVLYAKEFFVAWEFVPFLLMSFVFGGLSGFFGSICISVKNTNIVSVSTIVGAVVNAVMNLILIYIMKSAMGAAVATLVSNVVIWNIRKCASKKYIRLRIPLFKHILMYFLLIFQSIVCLQGFNSFSIGLQGVAFISIILLNINEVIDIMKKFFSFKSLFLKKKE